MSTLLNTFGVLAILYASYQIYQVIMRYFRLKSRLNEAKSEAKGTLDQKLGEQVDQKAYIFEKKITEEIYFSEMNWTFYQFITYSTVSAVCFSFIGTYGLNNSKAAFYLAVVGGFLPYVRIYLRSNKKRFKINENLVNYLIKVLNQYSTTKNIRTAFINAAKEAKYPVLVEAERLADRLNSGHKVSVEVEHMASRLNNTWLTSIADFIKYHEEFGTDLSGPLTSIVHDMQVSVSEKKEFRNTQFFTRVMTIIFYLLCGYLIFYIGSRIPQTFYYFTQTDGGQQMVVYLVMLLLGAFVIFLYQARVGD